MERNGKVAIVTGSGQGIGRAIALELARTGAKLVLAEIRKDTMEKVENEIKEIGAEVLPVQTDVSKWQDAERMAKRVGERFGRIDILVNNAGVSPKGKGGVRLGILDIGDEDWDDVMNVNLKGVFNCSKAVIPFMIKQRSGKIVNIGSISGLTGGSGGSPAAASYCASKAGAICLTKALAMELAPYHINVNVIAPGRVMTEMFKVTSSEVNEQMKRNTPLGRFGKPEEIAKAVVFLVSDGADFITGETLVVDGGRIMR